VLYKGSHSFTCYQIRAIPVFTLQPQIITAPWPVHIAPTHGRMARLSCPDEFPAPRVTNPSTNQARRWVTSVIWPTSLPTMPNRHLTFTLEVSGQGLGLVYITAKNDRIPTRHDPIRLKIPSVYIVSRPRSATFSQVWTFLLNRIGSYSTYAWSETVLAAAATGASWALPTVL